jgi:SET domain-containing protein
MPAELERAGIATEGGAGARSGRIAVLLIRTYLAPSAIHGIGVFAAEGVAAGQPVWQFAPGLDLVIGVEQRATLPEAFKSYLDTYAYASEDVEEGAVVLSCDHAKFLNHSEDPNTRAAGR